MRAEAAAAERSKEVREAAQAWRRAGFVDDDTRSQIVARYPDDRRRFGLGFRVLAFIFTSVAVWASVGLSIVWLEPDLEKAGLYLAWALVLAALTEFQRGPWARANAGAESATGLISVCLGIVAGVLATGDPFDHGIAIRILASACALSLAAAWRWGDGLFFFGASLAGFGLLAQTAHGRLWWILASLLLIPACLRAARSPAHAPSHRRGAMLGGAVAVLALYLAVHIWSLDQGLIEDMGPFDSSAGAPSPLLRALSILATAVLPLALLAIGWRRREPLLLYSGLLLIWVSIATIRLYREVMPLSLALILIGTACLALALSVRRWLRAGPGGERAGFTADPLFDNANRTEVIQSVVAMASFTPSAQAAPGRSGFEGGGGSFGGGGATGTY